MTCLRLFVIGGDKLEAQFEAIHRNPDVLVCTPGRLAHLLVEMNNDLSLEKVQVLVFDEADRLFELGFKEQMELIMNKCPATRYLYICRPFIYIPFSYLFILDKQCCSLLLYQNSCWSSVVQA